MYTSLNQQICAFNRGEVHRLPEILAEFWQNAMLPKNQGTPSPPAMYTSLSNKYLHSIEAVQMKRRKGRKDESIEIILCNVLPFDKSRTREAEDMNILGI